ncbi:protein kinase [Allosaccharopolyspora coralli]|uniref:non-specific serine/threonine protein kinase n=1 Tax=Allosaccharopolyspora coralli TaxID=2665642 RepID=A0A5Q3Q636_9PSEU|nr:serine/threonine-protein kinase [Allosaccharopolyspora coralli]QGK68926.1 protein kinase [Allosaccharopolyspora coralli]
MAQHRVIAGRYELTSPIGRGAMGEVWAAYDTRLDRPIAVKLLPATKIADTENPETIRQRFVRESRLTARVEHVGVPAVHDAGSDGDDLFLVMQLIDGIDLADLVAERGALAEGWAAAIGAQIAGVLAAAHDASLVHRDLKPSNVMVDSHGTVKVLDFGIAAALGANVTRLTATHETLGTPAYMAPEQAMSGTATPRSDLYSLGCVLHEMLCGEQVFTAKLPLALLHKHLDEPPAPLRQCGVSVSEEVEELVLDLLAKDPESRPENAHEVYRRLIPFLPVPEHTSSSVEGDPTGPYRAPLAPRASTRRQEPDLVSPPATSVSEDRIRADQERAHELVDDGRYTQAAELLRTLLADSAASAQLSFERGVKIRKNLAGFSFLGGDYRAALREYRVLLADADRGEVSPTEILTFKEMIASCRAELGEHTTAIADLRVLVDEHAQLLPEQVERSCELRLQLAMLLIHTDSADEARELLDDVVRVADEARLDEPAARARQLLRRLDALAQ